MSEKVLIVFSFGKVAFLFQQERTFPTHITKYTLTNCMDRTSADFQSSAVRVPNLHKTSFITVGETNGLPQETNA